MSKIYKDKEIFKEISYTEPFKWKHIKHLDLQTEDEIVSGWDEGFQSENNSLDSHYYMVVRRKVLETDEEEKERIENIKRDDERRMQKRKEWYHKLKEEFGEEKEAQY